MKFHELEGLIEKRQPGYTLPAAFYLDREIFDEDIARIFGRHWIYVGAEPEIAKAGQFFTVEIGADSVIIVRDGDMSVRAFHNVCRHRGARLCNPGSGTFVRLVCPYHQWTYNRRGELVNNKHMGEDFDRSQFGLRPAHVESLAGLIFICLAAEPPEDFALMRAAMEPTIAPHDIANCKVAHQYDLLEKGNWKLTMENNRECYHCRANHPQLTASLYEYGFGYEASPDNHVKMQEFEELVKAEHARWEACGLPSAEIERLEATTGFRSVRLPLSQSGESQTLDTRVACRKLLGSFTQSNLGGLSFWTQPNSWHHFMSDHIVSFSVLPVAPGQTLLRTRWLVHKDAQEGVDYDLDDLTAVWKATNDQDSSLIARAHQGISSPAYLPGPYSPFTENLVDSFCLWYLRHLQAAA
ncbi:MAG TPA: aromatic ring-hydroxylating dioxygenase subunit alpha [Steroidobacteraceae bacterium]